MSLTFKLLSLAIRTAAKPIGNYIKRQAKEHDGFRRFAINQAQRVHRIDMRMRLGILHDPEAQQRMHEREKKVAEEKKRREELPTVRTEAEQQKYDEQKAKEEAGGGRKKEDDKPHKVKIRPLSDTRAIELGANFFSEAFIFAVAAGLLVWDSWRSRRKESARRDDVSERLLELETEVESIRSKLDPDLETIHDLGDRIRAAKKARETFSWYNPWTWGRRQSEDTAIMEEEHELRSPPKAEEDQPIVPIRKAKAISDRTVEDEKESRAKSASKDEAKKEDEKTTNTKQKSAARLETVTAGTKER